MKQRGGSIGIKLQIPVFARFILFGVALAAAISLPTRSARV
jgi:hypothetical protein